MVSIVLVFLKEQNRSIGLFLLPILFSAIFIFGGAGVAYAANTCQSNGSGGGNFNVAATWTSCTNAGTTPVNIPATGDSIQIKSGDTVTLDAAHTVGKVIIDTGGILDENAKTLTDSGDFTNNGSVIGATGTSRLTLSGSGTNIGGSGSYTPTGLVTISTGAKTILSSSALSFPSVTITSVTVTNNSTAGFTVTTALAGTGGLTQGPNAVLILGGTSAIATLTATASGNTVKYNGSGAQILNGTTYENLLIASGNTVTNSGANTSIQSTGSLSITSGTLNLSTKDFTNNSSTSVTGTLNDSSSTGVNAFVGLITVSGTWTSSGNAGYEIEGGVSNNGTFTSGSGIYTFDTNSQNIDGTNAISISNVTVNGVTATNTNTAGLTVGTALSGTGTLKQGTGAILNIGGTSAISTLNASTNVNDVHYTSTSAAQTINSTTYHNLFIDKSSKVGTLGGAITVNNNLSVTAGTLADGGFQITGNATGVLAVSAGATLTLGSPATATAFPTTFTSAHISLPTTSTVNYNSDQAQTISNVSTYGNLTLTATVPVTKTPSGSITINGILSILVNNTFSNSVTTTVVGALSGAGILIQNAGSVLNLGAAATVGTLNASVNSNEVHYNGTGNQTVEAANYYNLFLEEPSGKSAKGAGGFASMAVAGNLTVGKSTGGPWGTFDPVSNIVTVTGTTDIYGTLADTSGNSPSADTFNGLITVHSGGSWAVTPGESCQFFFHNGLAFSGTSFVGGTGNYTFNTNNQAITGSSALSIQHLIVTGIQLTNSNTSSVSIPGNGDLSGTGEWIQDVNSVLNIGGPSTINTLTAGASGNTVNYNGSIGQIVHAGTYQTLNVSGNTNGNVNITGDTTANTVLTLGATIFSTDVHKMIISAGATLSRTTGFINGMLQKYVSAGTPSPAFEIGSGTNYTPVSLSFNSVTTPGDVVASTTPIDHTNIATSDLNASKTANRFYTLSNSGVVFASYDVAFTFVPIDVDSGANTAHFVLAQFNTGVWSRPTLGTVTATSVGGTGLTSFGDFQIGETNEPVSQFVLNDPGNMTAGTRLGYTLTRRDQYSDPVTLGATTIYLFSNSAGVGAPLFYDVASGGSSMTSIVIPDGQSSTFMWYFDPNPGTWTVTASDNVSAPDGVTGVVDASDSTDVAAAPIVATKFVIVPPTNGTVDAAIPITVQAEDDSGNVDTTQNTGVTLNATGFATGGGLVSIVNGIGTISISDTAAENVNLSLTDTEGTGLGVSSTQTVTFSPGAAAQFSLDNPGDVAAGTRIGYTVTRKDTYGNIVTTGATTVYLYSTSDGVNKKFYDAVSGGSVITAIVIPDGQSSIGFWYYDEKAGNWFITTSDNVAAPDGATGVDDASDAIAVQPAAAAKFFLNDPGGMTVGTRLGYTVTRKDQFNNLVTTGVSLAYLYSSSSGTTTAFYTAASGGLQTTLATINDGSSSGTFWYYDATPGTWVVTASDNTTAPDGATGMQDAVDSVSVSSVPIVATRFVVLAAGPVQIGTPVTITIEAEDNSGNIDTTYQNDVTLVQNGSATGAGLVDIVNGIGTKTLDDSIAETLSLTLSDTESTGLDVSSSQILVFSATPVSPSSIGGGGPGVPIVPAIVGVQLTGLAFSNANINLLAMSPGGEQIIGHTVAAANASFSILLSGVPAGANAIGVEGIDALGRVTQTRVLTANYANKNSLLNVDAILLSPAFGLIHPIVRAGDMAGFVGEAVPGYTIEAQIDGETLSSTTIAAADGSYKIPFSTAGLSLGSHTARALQISPSGVKSDDTPQKIFTVTSLFTPQTDFNQDGVISVQDWSIFLSRWGAVNPAAHALADLNGDGRVDVTDFSIFVRTLKR